MELKNTIISMVDSPPNSQFGITLIFPHQAAILDVSQRDEFPFVRSSLCHFPCRFPSHRNYQHNSLSL